MYVLTQEPNGQMPVRLHQTEAKQDQSAKHTW